MSRPSSVDIPSLPEESPQARSPPSASSLRTRPRLPGGPRNPTNKPSLQNIGVSLPNMERRPSLPTSSLSTSPTVSASSPALPVSTLLDAPPPNYGASQRGRSTHYSPDNYLSRTSSPAPPSPGPSLSTNPNSRQRSLERKVEKISLPSPPPVNFEGVPVAWRSLTLNAAQWNLSSAELQQMVSRAIRRSAEESSIRLVPLETLDHDLKDETVRLEDLRINLQSKYKFGVHRRSMLLQSLAATASSPLDGASPTIIGNLARNLAEMSTGTDRLVEELVRALDQQIQINRLVDQHSSSALAVALRKLNGSYAKRMKEMQEMQQRLASVEAERDEAWRVAEEIAKEVDDELQFDDGDVEGDGLTDLDHTVEMVNITGRAVAMPATLTRASRIGGRRAFALTDGEASSSSASRTRGSSPSPGSVPQPSHRKTRSRADSVSSRVSAARTRSVRASAASLRIPRVHRGTSSRGVSPSEAVPQLPPLPTSNALVDGNATSLRIPPMPPSSVQHTPPQMLVTSPIELVAFPSVSPTSKGSSFLEMETDTQSGPSFPYSASNYTSRRNIQSDAGAYAGFGLEDEESEDEDDEEGGGQILIAPPAISHPFSAPLVDQHSSREGDNEPRTQSMLPRLWRPSIVTNVPLLRRPESEVSSIDQLVGLPYDTPPGSGSTSAISGVSGPDTSSVSGPRETAKQDDSLAEASSSRYISKLSDRVKASSKRRPSSMPISAVTPSGTDKPWSYF